MAIAFRTIVALHCLKRNFAMMLFLHCLERAFAMAVIFALIGGSFCKNCSFCAVFSFCNDRNAAYFTMIRCCNDYSFDVLEAFGKAAVFAILSAYSCCDA